MKSRDVVAGYLGQDSEHQSPTREGATAGERLFPGLVMPNHCAFMTEGSWALPPETWVPVEALNQQPYLLYTPLIMSLLASESQNHQGPLVPIVAGVFLVVQLR